MIKPFFEIKGVNVDENLILKEIEESIQGIEQNQQKITDFTDINNDDEFLKHYLNVIQKSYHVDINDFEIPQKKGFFGKVECFIKKIIWKCLKFYTYRLFSQQIEFNSEIKNTVLLLNKKHQDKLRNLEKEINELEKQTGIKAS